MSGPFSLWNNNQYTSQPYSNQGQGPPPDSFGDSDPAKQAKLFRELQEQAQSLNQMLQRSNITDVLYSTATGSNGLNSGYIGLQSSMGARLVHGAPAYDISVRSQGARSIDQILQSLKQKTQESQLRMDEAAENQSKAFFSSKGIDVAEIEHQVKTTMNTFSLYQKKQLEVKEKPLSAIHHKNLILKYVDSGAGEDKLTLSNQSYKEKLLAGPLQQPLFIEYKQELGRSFGNQLVEKFKQASKTIQLTVGKKITMAPPGEFQLVQSSIQRDNTQQAPAQTVIKTDKYLNEFRDNGSPMSYQLLRDIAEKRVTVFYDDKFMRELQNRVSQKFLPLDYQNNRETFEAYSMGLKGYTEEKYYSQNQNLPAYIDRIITYERDKTKGYIYSNAMNDLDGSWTLKQQMHQTFLDTFELLSQFARAPQLNQLNDRDLFLDSVKYQRFIARSTCEFLEKDYKLNMIPQNPNIVEAFEEHITKLLSKYELKNPQYYIFYHDETQTYPFGVAFFMFRTGQHDHAIRYLEQFPDDQVKKFGNMYKRYYKEYEKLIMRSQVEAFQRQCQVITTGINDLYLEALISLMIGSKFQCQDEQIFYEVLTGYELETQLWFKLKLACYEYKAEDENLSSFQEPIMLPSDYQTQNLEDLQKFITETLGPQEFKQNSNSEDPSDILTYFKELLQVKDFFIQGAHIALILNELGILKTRYGLLNFIQGPLYDIAKETQDDLPKILDQCFDLHGCVIQLIKQAETQQYYKTEVVSLILCLQEQSLVLYELAQYIIKNDLYELLLESDPLISILGGFEINKQMTLRALISEQVYIELVKKVAKMNENTLNAQINVLIFDKIQDFDGVLKQLNALQRDQIQRCIHPYFLITDLTNEQAQMIALQDFLKRPPFDESEQIQKQYSSLLNQYEKKKLKQKYQTRYLVLDSLGFIFQAVMKIDYQQFEAALADFGQLYFLPVKLKDDPYQKAKLFDNLDEELKIIVFDILIVIGKCIQLAYNNIKKDTHGLTDLSKFNQLKLDKLYEHRNLLERLAIYLDYLRQNISNKSLDEPRLREVHAFIKKMQMNVA
ncbi:UNKNOWN [Stylonychia lemnae]|uniref:Nuclear pore protein n=1 Tax=Stylonychia lemnae TaxID=5949 RepID=A0A078AIF0_STYLE|nr:UNKNOWN [Stylonychia lemnae]|eukprot:CDW81994.1 UNKNOWN [Stylonychia lemnae]